MWCRPKADSTAQATAFITVSRLDSQTSVSTTAILPTSSTQASESAYTPKPPADVFRVNSSCPSSGHFTVNVMGQNSDFACSAQTDFPGNDIAGLVAYTLQQCLESCSLMNIVQGKKVCLAVAHSEKLSQGYSQYRANCFLKTSADGKVAQPDWTGLTLA